MFQPKHMKKKNKVKSKAGKLGAMATHRKRYDMLIELSKKVDPQLYRFLHKWPTEHLKVLLKAYSKDE